MKVFSWFLASICIFQALLGATLWADESSGPRRVYVAQMRGSINPAGAAYLSRVIRLADEDPQAEAVLIELDTPGGLLSSTRSIIQSIAKSRRPVLIFVSPSGASATSAGAILMLSAHGSGMAPGTNIGAAHPVGSKGENIGGDMKEKVVNDTVALVKSVAQERRRPVEAAEKMVRSSSSYTASEALKLQLIDSFVETPFDFLKAMSGKKVFVEGIGHDLTLNLREPVIFPVEMSWGQKLLHFLADPNVATVLMSLGMLLIYVEVSTPGITIAGVLGGVCLIAGFMAFQLLPIRAGGLALLLLGLVMIVVEVITPAHGALAVGGLISLVLGILWVMDPSSGALQISPMVWVPVLVTFSALVFFIGWITARSRRQVAQALRALKGTGPGGLEGYLGEVDWVNPQDRYAGTATFRGEIWSIRSEKNELQLGQSVRVERVEGLLAYIVLEKLEK